MDYELELDRVSEEIRKQKAKLVCIQLPEGLRSRVGGISSSLESKTGAKVIVWLGSCFGACDVPFEIEKLGVDLLIQWGHSEWKR